MQWYEYIKAVMKHREVTQDEIAALVEKTRGGVGHWLAGRREPEVLELKKIIDYLGIDYYAMFGDVKEHELMESLYDKELSGISKKISDDGRAQLKQFAETISKAEQSNAS